MKIAIKSSILSTILVPFLFPTISVPAGSLPRREQQELTVERIFGQPGLSGSLPAGIKWSPDGKRLTFLRAGEGSEVQDLWFYDVATGERSILVKAAALTRGEQVYSKEEAAMRERMRITAAGITSYLWSPSGSSLLFPINGDLYHLDLMDREVKRLTKTRAAEIDPKFSPDGRWVSFVREGDLFVVNPADGREIRLTRGATDQVQYGVSEYVAQEEMDRFTGYWWSPDSQRIALLKIDNSPVSEFHIPNYHTPQVEIEKQEYPRAGQANTIVKVGVTGIAQPKMVWMDTGDGEDHYIPRVQWLPDGKRLAIQIQSRDQDRLDLYFHDVTTGKGRRALREQDSTWVNLHDHLHFFKDGSRFLWSSERDGFRHFYLYRIDGQLSRQVTRGAWMVETLAGVDEKAGLLYFTTTEKSPLERHLYTVKLDGTGLERITTGEGWHTPAMAPEFDFFLDAFSDPLRPTQLTLRRTSGDLITTVEANEVRELEGYALSVPEFSSIESEDGQTLHTMMIKPPVFDPTKRYPVLVYVYGGPGVQVVAKRWGGDRFLWHQMMAQMGYVVFYLDNRGSAGRGRAFERSLHKRLGYRETRDQLAGVAYLRTLTFVDPGRIGIWGWSYGGYMTCMSLFSSGSPFRAGIAVAPVVDWHNYDTHYTERYLERPQENPEGYRESSPVTLTRGLTGKLLVVHGLADDNVHFQETVQLVDELINQGKRFELMFYPKKKHGIAGTEARIHLFKLMTDFLGRNL
ncbi:MAG: S9 family peptidase [Acidobacteria bacterium]|nr:S9 family peptidase [Acidobacteriota bacterium]